jgi:hypothetical protein
LKRYLVFFILNSFLHRVSVSRPLSVEKKVWGRNEDVVPFEEERKRQFHGNKKVDIVPCGNERKGWFHAGRKEYSYMWRRKEHLVPCVQERKMW